MSFAINQLYSEVLKKFEASSSSKYEPSALKGFNLEERRYYLIIARLEPDNNVKLIVEAFKNSSSELKLAIVGPLSNTSYVKELLQLSSS